jgi:hypothetical protein
MPSLMGTKWAQSMGRRRLIIGCEQSALAWINSRSRRSFQTKRSGIAFLRR